MGYSDQLRLYELVWKRTVACQMIHATLNNVSVQLGCGSGNVFRASGSTIKKPGFMSVYMEGNEDSRMDKLSDKMLPELNEGENIELLDIRSDQHFTQPPPRFTEASLVKAMEEFGIGRPSTYASIMSTLVRRQYTELDRRRFKPTDTGRVVERFLENHFNEYVDYEFTARMEDSLDEISRGEKDWIPLLAAFWKDFQKRVGEKGESVDPREAKGTRVLGTDPKSGKPVSVRVGRFGPHAQIGTRDDEEKPTFAGLRPGQSLETITFEEALELFKLPRELGETPEGEEVVAAIGRFGPYIRYGSKFVSLKDADPHDVTLEHALKLVAEKKEFEANRIIKTFEGTDIQVLRGRYGPYITDGNKNARIPKDQEPETLTQSEISSAFKRITKLFSKSLDRKFHEGLLSNHHGIKPLK